MVQETNKGYYQNWSPMPAPAANPRSGAFNTGSNGPGYQRLDQRPQSPEGQKVRAPERMPKAKALTLARRLKRGLLVVSFACFGTIGGMVAFHQITTTTAATTTKTTTSSSSTSQSTQSNSSNSSSSSNNQTSGGFLTQSGGNNFGTSSSSSSANAGSSAS